MKSPEEIARELANKLEGLAWSDDGKYLQTSIPLIAAAIQSERAKVEMLKKAATKYLSHDAPGTIHDGMDEEGVLIKCQCELCTALKELESL
jgi:hypothetical protein